MRRLGAFAAAAALAVFVYWKLQPPVILAGPLTELTARSVRANWTSTFEEGTVYTIQLARAADFADLLDTTRTTSFTCVFTGLDANTAVHARVSTAAAGPYTILGDTVTAVETPAAIVFDEIAANAITASAYAPSPAFSRLEKGLSGVDVSMDGAYAGWRNGNVWKAVSAMTVARFIPGAAAAADKVYAVGGYGGAEGIQTSVEAYDPASGRWSARSSLSVGRNYLAAAALDGLLYALGGFNGSSFLAANEAYDPVENRWRTRAPMTSPRGAFAAVAHGGRLYAFGGQGESTEQASSESYDPASDAWTSGPPMSASRAGTAAAVLNGKIHVLGGGRSSGGKLTISGENERYDPARGVWERSARMPTARGGLVAAAVGGKLYAIGGLDGVAATGANEEYDAVADRWTARASMPSAREQMGAAVLAGKIYVVGGGDGNYSTGVAEEYDPGTARRFTGLAPNTRHEFAARARNQLGVETAESPKSAVYTAAAAPGPLGGGERPFVEFSSASFVVRWSSGSAREGYNPEGTEYRVELSKEWPFKAVSASVATKTASCRFEGLPPGADFAVRVRALNGDGLPTRAADLGVARTLPAGL